MSLSVPIGCLFEVSFIFLGCLLDVFDCFLGVSGCFLGVPGVYLKYLLGFSGLSLGCLFVVSGSVSWVCLLGASEVFHE